MKRWGEEVLVSNNTGTATRAMDIILLMRKRKFAVVFENLVGMAWDSYLREMHLLVSPWLKCSW